jgi:two-component system cell cycle sensor histidine kinase/response regulator CckA
MQSSPAHREFSSLSMSRGISGGIAHDFNNLLTGIMGNISLVLSDLDSRDARYPALADAEKAAQSARELTRQLLAFSRKEIVEPKVTDLNALIEGMLRMLERIIGAGIELRAITQPDLWNVRVDQGQVNQIIVNLVVNARDAMPHGGRLTIETRNITLVGGGHGARAMAEPGNYVMLEVSDTGTGMTDEVKSHIFEPFFTTKERGKGTGLGLAMVYGAVRQNCGIIEADSEVGRGAAFRMLFPRVNEEVEAITQRAASDEVAGGTETILLVEDEPLVNSLAARLLTKLGYTVISCPDWREALTGSRTYDGRIQLLITDTVMPGMSGKTLAAELLRERPEMRVLFTSGYPEELVGENGMREGGFAFIGKPFTIQALGQKVREVLES